MLTVGEPITIESLQRLSFYANYPYKLTIWYDTCGKGVDWDFLRKLELHTDDIVVLYQNKGSCSAMGFAFLYLDYEYLIYTCCDFLAKEGYMDKLLRPFIYLEKVAIVGEAHRKDFDGDFIVSSSARRIDGMMMVSKKAVNELGGISPSFKGYSGEMVEWQERARVKGWNFVAIKDVDDHDQTETRSRLVNKNFEEMLDHNCQVVYETNRSGFTGYDWWREDLKETLKEKHDALVIH